MNNNSRKRKQEITALMIMSTLLLSGCASKYSRFELVENENNEIVAVDDSYIDSEHISDYYVVEVYNKMIQKNEIYIALKDGKRNWDDGTYYYIYNNVFTNLEIVNTSDEEFVLEYVKETNLYDYIVSLGLEQYDYSYEDMKNIYEIIKENYVFNQDNSLKRTRTYDKEYNNRLI